MLARRCGRAEALISAVRSFSRHRILVVGDLMLDRFIWGTVHRISPEAPVPVVEIQRESTCLGGAANVSANIRSLRGIPLTLGVIGNDFEGRRLREECLSLGLPVTALVEDPERATTVKTRIIAQHQQVCRTDREDKSPLSPRIRERVVRKFHATLVPI